MNIADRATWLFGLGCLLVVSVGCRAGVQKIQMERVDQEPGGNRGYFVGSAPPPAPRRDTREIAELQVELPTKQPAATRPSRMTETPRMAEAPMVVLPEPEEPGEMYTVQKGDTLWSIARKFYGKGTFWPRIFDANRDQLSEPGRLRAGMRLRIPAAEEASVPSETYTK